MSVERLKQELTHRGLPSRPGLARRQTTPLAQQLATTVMLPEMKRMLDAGDAESIRMWLDAGVDADNATGRVDPLHIACDKGHFWIW